MYHFDVSTIVAPLTTSRQLTAKQRFRYSGFVAGISSQSEGLGKMALGIVKIYLGSPFSANRRCPRSGGSRLVVVDPIDEGRAHVSNAFFLNTAFLGSSTTFCNEIPYGKFNYVT